MTQTSDPARQDSPYYNRVYSFCQEFFNIFLTFYKKDLLFLPKRDKISGVRSVAQPGRVLALGARCRWFESSRSDHLEKPPQRVAFL